MKNRKIKSVALSVLHLAALIGWFVVDANAQILTPGEIIYGRAATGPGGNCDTATIWVVGLDGSNDRLITNGLHPRISPDGRYILFERFSSNVSCAPFTNGAPQWWLRDLARRRESQISQNSGIAFGFFFSPETNRADQQIIFDDGTAICTMNLDGANRSCLVGNAGQLVPMRFAKHPSVRGGDNLVVIADHDSNFQPTGGLYTLIYDTLGNIQKIPNTDYGDLSPSWSNDGQTIAFAFYPSPCCRTEPYFFTNLFKIKPDGTGKTQLTNVTVAPGEGFGHSLVWTNDNQTIINAAKLNGVAGIYKIAANGSGIQGMIPISAGAPPDWVGGIAPVYSEAQVAAFGGGVTGNGTFTLVSTAGQGFAGQTSIGGSYNFESGFWAIPSPSRKVPFDFDGDGKTDASIFRPNGATGSEWWYLKSSNGGNFATQFGTPTDKLVAADYTGDGKADIAFWRPSTGQWFILRSEDSSFYAFPFGAAGDVPAPADYDGDGKADAAVFRSSNSTWFIQNSGGGTTIQAFGAAGDLPVVGDYDGDGKADLAIFRPNGATGSEWWYLKSSNGGNFATQFGTPTDKTVPGDYTGDGKTDIAFWRPSTGQWYILRSEDLSFFAFPFGSNGDIPVPGDYDGDGKTDAAVFRPSSSTWFAQGSTSGTIIQQFGAAGDVPVPSEFVW